MSGQVDCGSLCFILSVVRGHYKVLAAGGGWSTVGSCWWGTVNTEQLRRLCRSPDGRNIVKA